MPGNVITSLAEIGRQIARVLSAIADSESNILDGRIGLVGGSRISTSSLGLQIVHDTLGNGKNGTITGFSWRNPSGQSYCQEIRVITGNGEPEGTLLFERGSHVPLGIRFKDGFRVRANMQGFASSCTISVAYVEDNVP